MKESERGRSRDLSREGKTGRKIDAAKKQGPRGDAYLLEIREKKFPRIGRKNRSNELRIRKKLESRGEEGSDEKKISGKKGVPQEVSSWSD